MNSYYSGEIYKIGIAKAIPINFKIYGGNYMKINDKVKLIFGLTVIIAAGCNPVHKQEPLPVCPTYDYNCIECGKGHNIEDSYYCEDGMSACSEDCYVKVTGERRFDRCEECKKDIRIWIDNEGGYVCPHCGFEK